MGTSFNATFAGRVGVDTFVLTFLDNPNTFPAIKANADREAALRKAYTAITGMAAPASPPKTAAPVAPAPIPEQTK